MECQPQSVELINISGSQILHTKADRGATNNTVGISWKPWPTYNVACSRVRFMSSWYSNRLKAVDFYVFYRKALCISGVKFFATLLQKNRMCHFFCDDFLLELTRWSNTLRHPRRILYRFHSREEQYFLYVCRT